MSGLGGRVAACGVGALRLRLRRPCRPHHDPVPPPQLLSIVHAQALATERAQGLLDAERAEFEASWEQWMQQQIAVGTAQPLPKVRRAAYSSPTLRERDAAHSRLPPPPSAACACIATHLAWVVRHLGNNVQLTRSKVRYVLPQWRTPIRAGMGALQASQNGRALLLGCKDRWVSVWEI